MKVNEGKLQEKLELRVLVLCLMLFKKKDMENGEKLLKMPLIKRCNQNLKDFS